MIRSYRYRLYPTRRQVIALEQQLAFGCDLYNAALEQRRYAWRRSRTQVRLGIQQEQLTELRRGLDLEMNYGAQQMILQRLDFAFEAFFRRVREGGAPGFPRFRSRRRFNTLTCAPANPAAPK